MHTRSLFRHCFNGFSTIANIINNNFIIIYLLLFIFINNEILCMGIRTTSLCPDPNFEDLAFYYLHSLILYIPISLSLLTQACRVNNSSNPNIYLLWTSPFKYLLLSSDFHPSSNDINTTMEESQHISPLSSFM